MTAGKSRTSGKSVQRPEYEVLSGMTIALAGLGLLVVAAVAVTLLLVHFGTDADKTKLEAIKTAGTVVVGTGGVAALWLAARRQRMTEIALRQKEVDQAQADRSHEFDERTAAEKRADDMERLATERYGKALEQLGSGQALVRLGGMYALERLADSTVDHRQMVVNVLCAYLRMPFAVDKAMDEQRAQEKQVRVTAQRILTARLGGADVWQGIDLDLAGATLFDFDLAGCQVGSATFAEARFEGMTSFKATKFAGNTWFDGTVFTADVWFDSARFGGEADFSGAGFGREVHFDETTFAGPAKFDSAVFTGLPRFIGTAFHQPISFDGAQFNEGARFNRARFDGDLSFDSASFAVQAEFPNAQFAAAVNFDGVRMSAAPNFDNALVRLDIARTVLRTWPVAWPGLSDQDGQPVDGAPGTWGRWPASAS